MAPTSPTEDHQTGPVSKMRGSPNVLVVASQFDPTADLVIERLHARGVPFFRCDVAEFPQQLSLDARFEHGRWVGTLRTEMRTMRLEDVRAVYYRRPTRFAFPDRMTRSEQRWAAGEARMGFGGVLTSLDCLWVNHPARVAYAEYKPVQLTAAARCGLQIPATTITNEDRPAQDFAADCPQGVVYKPLTQRTLVDGGKPQMLYTTRVVASDLDHTVQNTTHCFQEWVGKHYEVRLTVVGNVFFPVAIHGLSEKARVDWRSDYASHHYEECDLPARVRAAVTAVMGEFGLTYAAFDFVVDRDGTWWFLEVNPKGQWGWIQDATGAPIADALAAVLEKGSTE